MKKGGKIIKKIIGEIINLKQGIICKLERQGPELIFLRIEDDDNSKKGLFLNQSLPRKIIEEGLSLGDKVQIAIGYNSEILQVVKMAA